jgi:exopolyphosphatase/guanosine-5'-triphosphate,3'-diphosphate pyrophosphatase
MNIENFIGLGGELKTILSLCSSMEPNSEKNYLKSESLKKLYTKVYTQTTNQIKNENSLDRNQAEILLPSVILFHRILKMTNAKGILAPMSSLRHGMLIDSVDDWLDTKERFEALEDIVSSVWYIGAKYFIDRVHCEYVERIALSIFDQTKKIHRLDINARLHLRVAAILHDIGKYISLNNHDIHSYNIIHFQDILGFSDTDLKLVANIARYHSHDIPRQTDENYLMLDDTDQIIVSKLAAILRIAEALDISHKEKVNKIEVLFSGKEVHFHVWTSEDILLEEWNFAGNITFFEEVMGYKPVLIRRR